MTAAENCLRRLLNLPSKPELLHALCSHLPIRDVACVVVEYEFESTFALAHRHFTSHDGHFMDLSDLITVVLHIYQHGAKAKDVTARGPALLSYIRRLFGGVPCVEMWPEQMQEPAKQILTSCKGFYRASCWSFDKRIDTMEDQYAFCECDNCRYENRPDVIEFLHDGRYLVHALELVVQGHCRSSTGDPSQDAHRQALVTHFFMPGFSVGHKFELARALCRD
jgi:hypothetical protein